ITTHATSSNAGRTDCKRCVFYFLVFGTCLALAALFFFVLAACAFSCFCDACLCAAFGDLSPMIRRVRSMTTGVNPEAGGVSFRGNFYLKSQRSFDNHAPMGQRQSSLRREAKTGNGTYGSQFISIYSRRLEIGSPDTRPAEPRSKILHRTGP